MPLIDLTHPINTTMPVYPGTRGPEITQACTVAEEGFAEKILRFYSHTGTHMDAPSHLIPNGRDLDSYPIDRFKGTGICVEIIDRPNHEIRLEELAQFADTIASADFLLLNTGWSQRWGSTAYFDQHPVLSSEAADWLTGFSLKAIGLDNISADRFDTKTYPVHKILLGNDILIIENIVHMDQLPMADFILTCLPLKLSTADGAPVRVIAEY